MPLVTRALPCHPAKHGKPTMMPFTGSDVGAFFIHRTNSDRLIDFFGADGWTITHRLTGYSVARRLKNKAIALKKAKLLEALQCWGFTDPAHVKTFSSELMAKIKAIKES